VEISSKKEIRQGIVFGEVKKIYEKNIQEIFTSYQPMLAKGFRFRLQPSGGINQTLFADRMLNRILTI